VYQLDFEHGHFVFHLFQPGFSGVTGSFKRFKWLFERDVLALWCFLGVGAANLSINRATH